MVLALAAALLLHHIEGVCKPKSPMTLLLERYAANLAQRDKQAAVERARERAETRRQAAVGRAQAREQAKADSKAAVQARRVQQAIEPPQPRMEWFQVDADGRRVEHRHREA
jgi:hypothetical protein